MADQNSINNIQVNKTGSTMTGALILNADPVASLQAATKQYVDSLATVGGQLKQACVAATTVTLTVTYSNGTLGVGATLTNAGAQAIFAVDGITPAVNSRILIKNQSSGLQNGIYSLTNVGSVSTNWVLTRVTDYDQAAEMIYGTAVIVILGTANNLTSWVQTTTVAVVGTDAITFSQLTYGTTFPGLTISGLTASKVVITNASKQLASSSVNSADLPYAILQNGTAVYGADAGSTDDYVITLVPVPAGYVEGMAVNFKANTANTGASTLNVNSLGAKTILKNHDQALATNDIEVGQILTVIYDGTNFQMQSQIANPATVTSVGATSTTGLVIANTPITSSGNISIDFPPSLSGKNLVINGTFQAFQRYAGGAGGATFDVPASTTQYTLDRWQLKTNAVQICTVSQAITSPTSAQTAVNVQRQVSQTGTGVVRFCNSFPRSACGNVAGNTVTVTIIARAGADYSAVSQALVLNVYSGTGTTDISGINAAFTGNVTNTTTLTLPIAPAAFQTYTYTTPAMGSTVTQLAVELAFTPVGTAGASDFFTARVVKVEIGSSSTPLVYPTLQEVLDLCYPYYQKSFLYATQPAANLGIGTGEFLYTASVAAALVNNGPSIIYPTPMRATATPTLFSPGTTGAQVYNETKSAACTSTNIRNATQKGFAVFATGTAASVVGDVLGVHYTVEAELT